MPSPQLRWSALAADAALATLSSGAATVSLEFRFAPNGEVAGIYAPARWGLFRGQYRQAPWEGRFARYQDVQGFWVPDEGEVGWYDDFVWRPVWKGRVHDAAYELAP